MSSPPDEKKNESYHLPSFLRDKFNDGFFENLEVSYIRELTGWSYYLFGIITYLIPPGVFITFAFLGYFEEIASEFISLDPNSGSCSPVGKTISGTFLGTMSGIWEGSFGFTYSDAVYIFNFFSFAGNNLDFQMALQEVEVQLIQIGQIAANSTLAYNLLLWMTWEYSFINNGNLQSVNLIGEANHIFDRDFKVGGLGSVVGRCDIRPEVEFDKTISVMGLTWNENRIRQECGNVILPEDLGYNPDYDGEFFTLRVDLFTVATAISVNVGINSHSSTLESAGDQLPFIEGYGMQPMYNPRHPGMKVLWCIFKANNSEVYDQGGYYYDDFTPLNVTDPDYIGCVIKQGPGFSLPVMMPWDQRCQSCSMNGSIPRYCDVIDIYTVMLFFDNGYDLVETLTNYTHQEITTLAYAASDYVMWGEFYCPYDPNFFSFCKNCTLYNIETYDSDDAYVNSYKFELFAGHCYDSISSSNFLMLGKAPPTPLTEPYYRCTSPPWSALFNALGIAMGNMDLFAPCLLVLTLPMIFIYQILIGKPPEKPESSEHDVDVDLKRFAKLLHSALDDPENQKYPEDSVLHRLAMELKKYDGRNGKLKKSAVKLKNARMLIRSASKLFGRKIPIDPESKDTETTARGGPDKAQLKDLENLSDVPISSLSRESSKQLSRESSKQLPEELLASSLPNEYHNDGVQRVSKYHAHLEKIDSGTLSVGARSIHHVAKKGNSEDKTTEAVSMNSVNSSHNDYDEHFPL